MKFKSNYSCLGNIKNLKRIEYKEKCVGNIDVFYALYKVETDTGELYAVAVGEDGSLSAISLGPENDSIGLYKTAYENEVGEVTFFDVADDLLYEKQHIVI